MKRLCKIVCISMVAVILYSGCGNSNSGRNIRNNNSVDVVLQNEINKSKQEEKPTVDTSSTIEDALNPALVLGKQEKYVDNTKTYQNVDIDISVMNSDMVYATVYQLMSEPYKYVQKTIKIKGNHYSTFYEPTGQTYHYALIQDATACCAQGIEFELADGFEYPAENAEIIVIGKFDTYEEEGYLYCVLRNAVIEYFALGAPPIHG